MKESVQTEQKLLEEVLTLRTRVAELEKAKAEQRHLFLCEQTLRHALVHMVEQQRQSIRASQIQVEELEARVESLQTDAQVLREASQHMNEFLSVVSHELRNPLTAINGNIQLAKRRLKHIAPGQESFPDGTQEILDQVQEMLSKAERQVRTQSRMVNDLLDVSRIQTKRLELHEQLVDMAELVREAIDHIHVSHPHRSLTLDLPEEPGISVAVDPGRIKQVLTNYVANAFKYSPPHSAVRVSLAIRENEAYVAVQDEGPGLAEQEQVRVWQRFYQVPSTKIYHGTGPGFGVGLYLCKTIIELHDGHVGVDSAPTQGATFWFTIPLL